VDRLCRGRSSISSAGNPRRRETEATRRGSVEAGGGRCDGHRCVCCTRSEYPWPRGRTCTCRATRNTFARPPLLSGISYFLPEQTLVTRRTAPVAVHRPPVPTPGVAAKSGSASRQRCPQAVRQGGADASSGVAAMGTDARRYHGEYVIACATHVLDKPSNGMLSRTLLSLRNARCRVRVCHRDTLRLRKLCAQVNATACHACNIRRQSTKQHHHRSRCAIASAPSTGGALAKGPPRVMH